MIGLTTKHAVCCIAFLLYLFYQKGKQKSPGRATSRSRSQPLSPGGREKVTQINVLTNKCTISTKTSCLFPKQVDQNAKRKKHIDKEQDKTKHEAPRSVNYRATKNKNNIGTAALEWSVVYTIRGRGFKGLSLCKLHPKSRYNS